MLFSQAPENLCGMVIRNHVLILLSFQWDSVYKFQRAITYLETHLTYLKMFP